MYLPDDKAGGWDIQKTLTIPKWLNDATIAKKLNFSKILQEALKHELNIG